MNFVERNPVMNNVSLLWGWIKASSEKGQTKGEYLLIIAVIVVSVATAALVAFKPF